MAAYRFGTKPNALFRLSKMVWLAGVTSCLSGTVNFFIFIFFYYDAVIDNAKMPRLISLENGGTTQMDGQFSLADTILNVPVFNNVHWLPDFCKYL